MRYLQHPQKPGWPWQSSVPGPVPISGMAWFQPMSEPSFPKRQNPALMPTSFVALTPDTLPVVISGIAWWRPFDQPEQVRVRADKQQFWMGLLYPGSLPVVISGIAWMKPWEPPYFPKSTKVFLQQTQFFTFPPRVPVSGMAWYQPFSYPLRPKQLQVTYQQTSAWINRPPPSIRARGYIIGPA